MQINTDFSGKNSGVKRNEDIMKSANFFTKYEAKENKEYGQISGGASPIDFKQIRQSRKKDSSGDLPGKTPAQLTFGPKLKINKPQVMYIVHFLYKFPIIGGRIR
jgi:type IV secretory pathway VirB6-like protein